ASSLCRGPSVSSSTRISPMWRRNRRSTGARELATRVRTTREAQMSEACPPTIGALLAGGLARRMGGGDKPLRRVGGRPILDHVVERMAPQCAGLVVNANGDPARFAPYGLPVVADDVPGFAGPLAGILAVLDHVAVRRRDAEWIVSVAADTPFLPPDLVERLHAARREEGAMLACAASGGRTHPVIGLWPVGIREDLRRALV